MAIEIVLIIFGFKFIKFNGPKELFRKDLRLTIDNPEDLIVCKAIYNKFKKDAPLFSLKKIINFQRARNEDFAS